MPKSSLIFWNELFTSSVELASPATALSIFTAAATAASEPISFLSFPMTPKIPCSEASTLSACDSSSLYCSKRFCISCDSGFSPASVRSRIVFLRFCVVFRKSDELIPKSFIWFAVLFAASCIDLILAATFVASPVKPFALSAVFFMSSPNSLTCWRALFARILICISRVFLSMDYPKDKEVGVYL